MFFTAWLKRYKAMHTRLGKLFSNWARWKSRQHNANMQSEKHKIGKKTHQQTSDKQISEQHLGGHLQSNFFCFVFFYFGQSGIKKHLKKSKKTA